MTQPTGLLAYWPTGLHELAYWVPVVWPLCAEREGGGGALVGGVVRLRASAPLLRTDIAGPVVALGRQHRSVALAQQGSLATERC